MGVKKGNIPWNKGLKGCKSNLSPFFREQLKQRMVIDNPSRRPEIRALLSRQKVEHNPMKGKKMSEENKEKHKMGLKRHWIERKKRPDYNEFLKKTSDNHSREKDSRMGTFLSIGTH